MEDDLMFSMEEVEGSAKRPPVQRSAPIQRASSLNDANASDDDDDDDDGDNLHFICPILDDTSAKNICHYLKNLVNNRQLSNSLPKSSFTYQVGHRRTLCEKKTRGEPGEMFERLSCSILLRPALVCENSCMSL